MKREEKVMVALENLCNAGISGYEEYFDQLKTNIERLFEQKKDVSKELSIILAYLEEMGKDPSIFREEPVIEVYEGQEVIWPTTLSLWQEDIEQIMEEAKVLNE